MLQISKKVLVVLLAIPLVGAVMVLTWSYVMVPLMEETMPPRMAAMMGMYPRAYRLQAQREDERRAREQQAMEEQARRSAELMKLLDKVAPLPNQTSQNPPDK